MLRTVAIAVLVGLAGCKKPAPSEELAGIADSPQPAAAPVKAATPSRPLPPGPVEIWREFSGDKAFNEARKQIEIGPRPSGSPELEKVRALIETGLRSAGWEVERQIFSDDTPHGPIGYVNLVGRFSPRGIHPAPTGTQRAIVCSHYDTKRFSTIRFVGASDGASSAGALIELARVLALDQALAEKVELVFFDGEEAIVQYDDKDGLFGSRHYASQLRASGRAAQFRFGILWDMIGDKDFGITLSPDSPAELTRGILASATALHIRDRFANYDRNIYDDHIPLNAIARIPAIDLIDFDYPSWHTADDTLERIAPESLRMTGAVTLHYLRQALK